MSLDDAVKLVLFAFENGNNGDLFVNKAPSSTILTLADAVSKIYNHSIPHITIGTRHGEKLYETLCTREEMQKAEDMGGFYRIPSDNRNLNYNKYFVEGKKELSAVEDYNSHNTTILDELGVINLLKKIKIK